MLARFRISYDLLGGLRIGIALLELVERFGSGTEALGQPIVIHGSEDAQIVHRRSDSIEFGAGETALERDLGEPLEHFPLRRPQLIARPICLPCSTRIVATTIALPVLSRLSRPTVNPSGSSRMLRWSL